jgi:hypothetical protein
MRTAAGWAGIGVLGVCCLAAAGKQQLVAPAAPPAAPAAKSPSVAQAPPDAATAKLIADLGSEDYRTREKAGQAIEAIGDKVLPHLRKALATTDNPEVSRRLAVMVRRMDHERLVAPRRVSLSVKDKTAKAVFDEISKQTGYRIQFNGGGPAGPDTKLSFEFDKAPFWQAVDKVADVAGMGVYADYDDEVVRVNTYQDAHNPYTCYAGPFRFVATNINSNRSIQLSGINKRGLQNTRTAESVGISVQINSEPKNPILGSTNYQADVLAATDDLGGNLIPPKDNNNYYRSGYYNQGYRGHNLSANINLVRASRDATKIKTLKAKMGIVLLAGVVPEVVIDDPVKAKNKTVVGRTVEVNYDSTTEGNGQYSVTLTAKKLGDQDQSNIDYNWSNSLWQKVQLVDDQGRAYHTYGPNSTNNNGHTVTMTIPFGTTNRRGEQVKLGKPVKLVVNEWLQVTHEVTFEFKDVPLP